MRGLQSCVFSFIKPRRNFAVLAHARRRWHSRTPPVKVGENEPSMIEYALLVAVGFLLAGLLALLFAGPFWRRAVRLTTKRLEATMPMSPADIQADKDQLRAEYAVEIRRLEMAYEREKEHAARFLVERNKHKVEIAEMKARLKALAADLAERENASTVLEQTIRKKIPELRQQLERARQIIAARDRELARMQTAYENQTDALGVAKKAAGRYSDEIERLRGALESAPAAAAGAEDNGEGAAVAENKRLQAEISRLRQEVGRLREEDAETAASLKAEMHELAERMLRGIPDEPAVPAASSADAGAAAETDAAADDGETPEETAGADSEKTSRRKKPARRDAGKKSSRGLSERLRQLTGKSDA
jgi:chromosome segregation ATPase